MSIRLSVGLQASVLSEFGLTAMMNYGVIDVYTGTQPASANNAPSGTLLGRITQSGDTFVPNTTSGGLQVEYSAAAGGLIKSGEWRLTGVATGTPGWWRWKWNAVDDNSSTIFLPRMDGAVGESLILGISQVTAATDIAISDFLVAFLGE